MRKQKMQRKIYISNSIKYCKSNGTEYADWYNYNNNNNKYIYIAPSAYTGLF